MEHATAGERVYTIEEFERLPEEDCRVELVRGWLVREPLPGAEHGRLSSRIAHLLERFLDDDPLGVVYVNSGFILATDPPTVRGPDVAYVAWDRANPGPEKGFYRGAPDLAIEIISPSNTADDVQAKVLEYFDGGASAVWLVYPKSHAIIVHFGRSGSERYGAGQVVDGGDILPGFSLAVDDLFTGRAAPPPAS